MRKSPTGDMAYERMNTLNGFLRERFGRKMIKLMLDGGFTCPNRDGTKGTGGCLFCNESASGDFARAASPDSISHALTDQIALFEEKWPDAGYIAYFQNHTNTYAPVEKLKALFGAALADPRVEGLAVATGPDCLPDDVLEYLGKLAKDNFIWVELGLQTSDDNIANTVNRCYPTSEYDLAMQRLCSIGIPTVTHIILGLPGESEDDMKESVRHACLSKTWGIKLHLLNVVKGSRLAADMPDYVPFSSMDEYVSLVCDIIEELPPDVVIHRLTGDAPRKILIAPEWSYRKRTIMNSINHELVRRDSFQGSRLTDINP